MYKIYKEKLKFKTFTPVQKKVFDIYKKQKSIVAIAPTGTGKTHAYGIPVIDSIDVSITRLQSIILVPTNELIRQVELMLLKLNQFVNHFIIPIINLFTFIVLSLSIIIFSLMINFKLTIMAGFIIVLFYVLILRGLRSRLRKNAQNSNIQADNVVEVLSQSFGGIKDILLNKLSINALNAFSDADLKYRQSKVVITTTF